MNSYYNYSITVQLGFLLYFNNDILTTVITILPSLNSIENGINDAFCTVRT